MKRVEATVEKIVAGGQGLARVEGEVVLVPRVAPGDRVALEIDRSKRPARGRVLKVLAQGEGRVEAPCALFERCGGCDLMHLSKDAQRDVRLGLVRDALARVAPDAAIEWHDASPARGRTRVRWHAKGLGDGRLVLGYHAPGSTTIVPIDACGAIDARLEGALEDARAVCAGARGEGEVHAAIGHGGVPVLALEWKSDLPPSVYAEAERRVRDGRLAGVEIALPGVKVPARIGDPRPVTAAHDGSPLVSPARGFAQASEAGDRVLVDRVLARAEADGKRVVELFSGSGNFTVALARVASQVTAVEISSEACAAARENLRARGLESRVKIVNADADAWALPREVDVVVLDPPRAGARGAARSIAERRPKRAVYVSCEPTTLARDLAVLTAAKMSIASVDAVDLFPDTSHVETVVTLVRS